jgi:hypothetical protein
MKKFSRRIKRLKEELMVGEFEYPEWWEIFKAIDPEGVDEMDTLLRKCKFDPEYVMFEWGRRIPTETLLELADLLRKMNQQDAEKRENNDVSETAATTDLTGGVGNCKVMIENSLEDTGGHSKK